MHVGEIVIADDVVRALVDRQFPQFAHLPLTRWAETGSSNVLHRLGGDLLVRLPRQPGGSATIDKEHMYLPLIARSLRVQVPTVVAVGEPDLGYSQRWSVLRWVAGRRPEVPLRPGADASRLARDLAATVAELHAIAVPPGAAADPALHWYRSDPIAAIDADVRQYLADCRTIAGLSLDLDACDRFWDTAMRRLQGSSAAPSCWIHADLVAENLLLRGGRLAAVLDFGGLAVGEPSVDLVFAWELFDARTRDVFRASLGVDDDQWARGRAWAFAVSVMTFPYYWRTMPGRCADRLAMVRAVLTDAAGEPDR